MNIVTSAINFKRALSIITALSRLKIFILYYRKIFTTALCSVLITAPAVVQAAGGLQVQAKLTTVKDWLITIVPVIAVIVLIATAIGFMLGAVEKMTFVRWAIALLIIGSASGIVGLIMS